MTNRLLSILQCYIFSYFFLILFYKMYDYDGQEQIIDLTTKLGRRAQEASS